MARKQNIHSTFSSHEGSFFFHESEATRATQQPSTGSKSLSTLMTSQNFPQQCPLPRLKAASLNIIFYLEAFHFNVVYFSLMGYPYPVLGRTLFAGSPSGCGHHGAEREVMLSSQGTWRVSRKLRVLKAAALDSLPPPRSR